MQAFDVRMSGVQSVTSDKPETSDSNNDVASVTEGISEQNFLGRASVHGAPFGELELQDYFGRELRSLYDHILYEEIPESFLKLITDLRTQKSQNS
jgi:hypothetical protein